MKKDRETVHVAFHSRAGNIFTALYKEFCLCSKHLSRRKQENDFQLLIGRYTYQLRHHLLNIAEELITHQGINHNRNELKQTLNQFILKYENDFVQKLRSS